MLMDAGETATQAKVDYDVVVRKIYKGIGFTSYVDDLSSAFRTKTSLHVGGLVLWVAGALYMYMREHGVQHKSPVVHAYID